MYLTVVLAALGALQGGQTVEKKNPTFEEMIRMRIVFSVPGMDAVSARRDLVYKTAESEPLYMDVYSPPGPPRPRPAVILVHGGPVPNLGATLDLLNHPEGRHGFEILDDDARSRQIIRRTLDFLRDRLAP